MSGMTVNGWRMMDALASFIGLSPRALPAGGLFDAAKGFASGKGCDEPTSKSHCGSFCTDHHYKPDECGCDVCGLRVRVTEKTFSSLCRRRRIVTRISALNIKV